MDWDKSSVLCAVLKKVDCDIVDNIDRSQSGQIFCHNNMCTVMY